jgi:hypothetical protein
MEILIKSNNTSLLENIVEALKDCMYIESANQDCDLSDRTIDVNEENKDLVIINIE